MVYFIIIRGGADTGKTILADNLKKKLNAKSFHLGNTIRKYKLDKYKKHNLKIDKGGTWIQKENYIKACNMILPKVIKLLNNKQIVIIEDNFYHKEVIDYLLENISFKGYVFSLKTSIKTCIKREATRKKLKNKEVVRSNKLANRFSWGYPIDTTTKTPKQVANKVLSSIQ